MDKVVNFWKNSSVNAKVIAIILVLLPIAALVITLVTLLMPADMGDSRLEISNYWEVTDSPKEYLYNIQHVILNAIGQKLGDHDAVYKDAVVREGSYREEKFGDVVKVRMIIDVPSIAQSFAIEFNYHQNARKYDDPDVNVSCPHYTEVIYKDSKCIAASPLTQVERYLPRYDYVDGVKYAVSLKKYNGESYLAIEVPAGGNAELMEAALNATKEWLKSIYLFPEDFKIEVVDVL